MNISKQLDNGCLTLVLQGRLDTTTAPLFEQELQNDLDGVTMLCLDFAQLDYISSAGLRVLLVSQKRMNQRQGSMVLCHVNETIKEVFDITGFSDLLTIE